MNNVIWTPGMKLEYIEKQVIQLAMSHYRNNKTAASQSLGISIRTLDGRLEKYDEDERIERERHDEERRKRDEYAARARGIPPAQYDTSATPRMGIQPPPVAAAQQAMSMPVGIEVQKMLPEKSARGRPRKSG